MAVISLQNVSLDFPIYSAKNTSIRHKLIQIGTGGLVRANSEGHSVVTALSDINLTIESGSRVGLIGHNGSGKSTLMRLIAGIYHPTTGTSKVVGNLATIFELGVGADQDLSGMENIYRISAMMGIKKSRIKALIPEILDFTQLEDFINLPVRTYSAGMAMRLYFAMALFSESEILMIDEIFGAGDAAFQARAHSFLKKKIYDSNIFLLASHSCDLIRNFCDRCIVMSRGKMVFFGDTEEAIEAYTEIATA